MLVTVLLTAGQGAYAAPLARSLGAKTNSQLVTLVTGERVLLRTAPDGRPMLETIRAAQSGAASQLTTVSLNGDQYAIPAVARPYLGRYLDPGLFDVTRLVAAGATDRTPLRITYKGSSAPSFPGVRITSSGHGVATGYVTASSAHVFGAALAAQAVADSQAGWPASSPLFGSITGIGPNPAAPATVNPDFPQVTLIIKEISHTGAPVPFGFGLLMNADNAARYFGFVFVVNGEARVSVPRGHYIGIFDEGTFTAGGNLVFRVMPVSDYAVLGDQQTLTVDARDAVIPPTVTTPQPSVGQELSVTLDASDATGRGGFSDGYDFTLPGAQILLAPSGPPAAGTFTETTRWVRIDPSSPGGRYTYDATFQDSGVPVDQAQTVPGPAHVATIHEQYDTDSFLRTGSATLRFVLTPGQFFASATFYPLPTPLTRTDYVYAPAGSLVSDTVAADLNAWDPGFVDEDLRSAEPGSERSDTWLRNPYGLGVPETTPADEFPLCYACRSATGMTIALLPNDGDPSHIVEVFSSPNGSEVAHFSVYRNGDLLLDESDSLGDVFDVPKGPGTYRVVEDLNRAFTDASLSRHVTTDVTFQSSGQSGLPMPPSWFCLTARNCRVLPVLSAFIDLNATPLSTVGLGTTNFDLWVGHIQGAADTAITKVTVSVRRAGGTSWALLPVTSLGGGNYRAAFNAHTVLDGQAMDLRVTATDTEGGILRQITTRAFQVSS